MKPKEENNTVRSVLVNAGHGYSVKIGSGLINDIGNMVNDVLNADRLALFIDSEVDRLYGDRLEGNLASAGFQTCRFVFPAGEASKNIKTVVDFIDFMSENHITRKDAVVAAGGGVAGDMGGFAAAIYLRGIKFIQVPTTLLSAVDSSVGGKTGVDTSAGKNLTGAFWQPSLVVCDTDLLKTNSKDLILDGTAEIIKTAAISDKKLFNYIKRTEISENLAEIIEQCVRIKGRVVEADEKEAGLRKILNFGHTMGHAIEMYSDFGISHGKAVAIGMLIVTKAFESHGLTAYGAFNELNDLISAKGFQTETKAPVNELCRLAMSDKKTSGDNIDLVYLKEIGEAGIYSVKLKDLYNFISC